MNFPLRRLPGRLFYCLISLLLAARLAHATGPATTTVSDIVYRADGSPAAGNLQITWPAFVTSDNKSVAAGSMQLAIGAAGAVTVALAPNAGANPTGTYYKVVYQLSDGTSSTEYWSVPSTSPTTISAIRSILVPAAVAGNFVTKAYVDSSVSAKANDAAVVHTIGNESVAGIKTFDAPPSVPTPAATTAALNKYYLHSLTHTAP